MCIDNNIYFLIIYCQMIDSKKIITLTILMIPIIVSVYIDIYMFPELEERVQKIASFEEDDFKIQ